MKEIERGAVKKEELVLGRGVELQSYRRLYLWRGGLWKVGSKEACK